MKNKNLVISGLCMSLAGLSVLFSQTIGVQTAQVLVPVFLILGGYFSYAFSKQLKDIKVGRQFHLFQAIGMLVFGVLVAFIPDSLESFLKFVTYFVMCFGFIEISFGLMAIGSNKTIKWNIVSFRLISGVLALIGAFVILMTSMTDALKSLTIAGILLLISGIAFIVFAQKLKRA
ncbi:MAG: DUF308 domain-containing protein [Flavobacteriales bacterium]